MLSGARFREGRGARDGLTNAVKDMIWRQGIFSGGMAMAAHMRMMLAAAGAAMVWACTPAAENKAPEPEAAAPSSASAEAGSGAGADAITPRNPLFGSWELIAARVAPWWDGKGAEPAPDPALSKITFTADKASGAPITTCAKPTYAANIVPERNLFEGNLPEPAKDAAALGFKDTSVTVLSFSCSDDARDVSLDFPMIDEQTIMLGLDNVLYTFRLGRG